MSWIPMSCGDCEKIPGMPDKKRILIVNCYFDELRIPMRRKLKFPQPITPAFLAGAFSRKRCDIKLYDEIYSGPLEDERILAFPDMLVLTGLNAAFDRMLHITAYVKTKNKKAVVVAGGPAIRAIPRYAGGFFDYCCTGDVEQLSDVIHDAFGPAYVSEVFKDKGWVIPRFDLAYWTNMISYVESSRNCYFRCNFCSLTAEHGKYQPYETEYLHHQFRTLGKRRWIHFSDNNFATPDRDFLLDRFALLKDLWKKGYFKKWGAEVTSDFFFEDENLELARDAGCVGLFSGVESFDNRALMQFNKYQNTRLPQVETIEKCLNAGIAFYYGIVLDLTTRPISELKEELDIIIGNPSITLPSFITLAIPLLKTPFFYECLNQNLFLPNIKLRDLDGTTINLRPLADPLPNAVRFVRDIQNLRGYHARVIRHMKNFFSRYRRALSWSNLAMSQYNAFLLCTPKLATGGYHGDGFFLNGYGKRRRTFIGSSEPLDSVYRPVFPIDSRYRHYFKPTMLTDKDGYLDEALHPDLSDNHFP
jgi:hopanoid C-2 methylase